MKILEEERLFDWTLNICLDFTACKLQSSPINYYRLGLNAAANVYILISLIIDLYGRVRDIGEFLEHTMYLIITLFPYIYLFLNKTVVNSLIATADGNLYRYDDDDNNADPMLEQRQYLEIWSTGRTAIRRKACWVFYLTVFTIMFVGLYPLITLFVYHHSNYRTLLDYREFTVFPIWNPFEVDTFAIYLSVCLFQIGPFFINTVCIASVFCLYFYIDGIIAIETKCLKRAMKSISAEQQSSLLLASSLLRKNKAIAVNGKDEKTYERLILSCFRHHRQIVKLVKSTTTSFKWPFFCSSLVAVCITIIHVYLLILTADRNSLKTTCHYANALLCVGLYFFACNIGQRFTEINRTFRDSVYRTNWYERSIQIRRENILTILCVTNWDLRLSITPKLFVCNIMFNLAMKWIYTVINFLIKVKYK
uniref:Odorant receptor n=1 Tax=Drosicha corpulenta TaxID=535978 RepID=A0A0U3UBJ3_9HEMI|nr:odorant receptor 15 [Drosicha corpulenta]